MMNALMVALHLLAAVVWVGGMFFAYLALRPAAAMTLEPPARLNLWAQTLARFFSWVWASVILLPATGFWMIFFIFQGFATVGMHVHIMLGVGSVMILVYFYLFFGPYPRLQQKVSDGDFPGAAQALNTIRKGVATNLTLGMIVSAIASGGRYL